MKKWITWMTVLICLAGVCVPAAAETGFETIYGLFCDEQVFGQPWAVNDMTEEETEKICFVVFMFDPDNDMTMPVLIGTDAEGANRYCVWGTGYERGALMLSFLIGQFAALKDVCEEGVNFCISYTFDGGETTTDITTVEDAETLNTILQQSMDDMESAEIVETP